MKIVRISKKKLKKIYKRLLNKMINLKKFRRKNQKIKIKINYLTLSKNLIKRILLIIQKSKKFLVIYNMLMKKVKKIMKFLRVKTTLKIMK